MLRTFDALMRERSVSRAAARLFLSQPAVSGSLQKLRSTFSDELFIRTSHGIKPTAKAMALADPVAKLLSDLAGLLESDTVFDPATSSRVFRLAGSDHASLRVLVPLSHTLSACGSGVRITWETGTSDLGDRLRKGELDLAVVARFQVPTGMQSEVLYEDGYVYVTRQDHPQVRQALTLDTFCATPQVFLGYGSSALEDTIEELLARQGRLRMARIAVSTFPQIVELLQKTDHAAVIARRVADSHAAHLAIYELPFTLRSHYVLMCWSARSEDLGLAWLKQQVRQAMIGETASER